MGPRAVPCVRAPPCLRCLRCLRFGAQAYETEKKVCEAFDDFERILTLDPGNSMAAAGFFACQVASCLNPKPWPLKPKTKILNPNLNPKP
jgi:hypothetical protein